jgi:uncharacterized OsmC-like protein
MQGSQPALGERGSSPELFAYPWQTGVRGIEFTWESDGNALRAVAAAQRSNCSKRKKSVVTFPGRGDGMARVLHVSKVKVHKEPGKDKIKAAEIQGFPGIVRMGVHGGVGQFFGLNPGEPLPSTLDYLVAAVGGCMTGTVAGALEARGIRADPEKLEAEAEGRIEEIDGKMILTNVSVKYRLKVPKEKRASVERALEHHEGICPVSVSVRRGITVEWATEIVEE